MCSVLSMYLHQEGIIIFYKSTVLQTKPIQHQPICISAHINRYVTLASFLPTELNVDDCKQLQTIITEEKSIFRIQGIY